MGFVFGAGYINCDILFSGASIPAEGKEVYSQGFDIQIGGGTATTLIRLNRLNIPIKFGTFIGTTMVCKMVESELEKYGVEYVNLYDGEKMPVIVSTVIITKNDRSFVSYMEKEDITEATQQSLVEISKGAGFSLMNADFIDLYREQKKAGMTMIFDTGWSDDLSLEKYKDYLEIADYYAPNIEEALKITNTKTADEAIEVLAKYFKKAMVKLDKEGCLIKENGIKKLVPPLEGITRVDSTGAGDSFLSGFIYGLYHQYEFEECIKLANTMGGLSVTKVGCLGREVTEEELLQLYKEF